MRYLGANSQDGLTLLEMLVVLVIAAIGALAADNWMMPSLQKNRVQASATRLLGALNLARSESILRNQPVSVCPSTTHATGTAGCSGRYTDGWMVFANADRDGDFDAGVDQVLRVYGSLPTGIGLTNRSGSRDADDIVHYLPSGQANRNQTLMFCSRLVPGMGDISIVLNIVGRPRLQRGWGECPGADT